MASGIGIKFTADGEREFKNALRQITQEYKVLDAQAKLNVAQFKENDTSVKALKTRNEDLQASIDKQKERIEVLATAVEKSADKYGEADTRTLKYKESLLKAETALTGMEKELRQNNEEIKKQDTVIGKVKGAVDGWKSKIAELKEKHETLHNGIHKVNEVAGKIAKGGLKMLAGAAVGAVAGVAAIGAAAIKAGKELAGLVKDAAAAGDEIGKNSQKIGVSAEQYQILSYEAERSGTSISTISKAAAKLKSSGSDLNVDEAIKKIAAIKDPAERSAAAVEMFGAKTAQELAPMINQGTEGLREMEKAARENGMIMSDTSVKAAEVFQDSLTSLKTTVSAVKNGIVSELLPGATKAIDGLTGLFSGQDGAAEKVKEGVTNMITSFNTMIPKALEIIKTLAGTLFEVAPDIVIALADGILDNLSPIMGSAIALIEKLTTGLLTEDNITKIMGAAVGVVTNLGSFLAEHVDLLMNSAFLCITTLCDGLLEDDNLSKLVTAALDIVLNLATGLIDHLPELLHATATIVTEVVKALLTYDWKTPGIQILKGLVNGVKSMFTEVKKMFSNVGRMMIDTIKDILGIHSPSTVFEGIGKNLLEGLWCGIQNMHDWLVDKLRGLGSSITDALKSVLGIASPSKVFENEIGKNLGLGIGVGFEKAMVDVKKDMENAIPTDFVLPDPNFNFPTPPVVDFPDPNFNFPNSRGFGCAQTLSTGGNESVILNVSVNIENFHNEKQQDINQLTDEISVLLAEKIRRKEAARG